MDWFKVAFDDEKVKIEVNAPGRAPRSESVQWADIIRICFVPNSLYECDELYIFTSKREESYLIPMEAVGASGLWNEIIRRKLFDAELAINAATGKDGSLFCWPPPP